MDFSKGVVPGFPLFKVVFAEFESSYNHALQGNSFLSLTLTRELLSWQYFQLNVLRQSTIEDMTSSSHVILDFYQHKHRPCISKIGHVAYGAEQTTQSYSIYS